MQKGSYIVINLTKIAMKERQNNAKMRTPLTTLKMETILHTTTSMKRYLIIIGRRRSQNLMKNMKIGF
jgi:hypothetical protein